MADTVEGVEVKLGADTAAATSGMQSASSSIAASLQAINATLQNFGATHKSTLAQAVQNNANLSRSFLELKGSATSGFNAIGGVIERFRGVLGSLAAALAGGLIGKEAVSSLVQFRDAVHSLQSEFGLTAVAATQMAVNLKLAGVNLDTYGMMAQRVSMRLHTQPQEFTRLGVAIKDAQGNLLPLNQILQNVYKTMLEYKPGSDQMQVALSLVGRNAKDFKEDMENLTLTNERAKQMIHDLGLEMGEDAQEKARQYKVEMNAFGLTLEAIGVKLGTMMMPALTKLAQWLISFGPSIIEGVTSAWKMLSETFAKLGAILAPLWTIATDVGSAVVKLAGGGDLVAKAFNVVLTVIEVVVQAIQKIQVAFQTFISIIFHVASGLNDMRASLLKLDFSGAADAIKATYADIVSDVDTAANKIVKINEDAAAKIKGIWAAAASPEYWGGEQKRGMAPQAPGAAPGTKKYTGPPKDDDQMAQLENQLKAQEDAYNNQKLLQGSFETWSETQTRDYWANVLATATLSAKERLEVENKYYDAERKLMTDAYSAHVAGLKKELEANKENQAEQERIMAEIVADTRLHSGEQSAQVQEALAAQIKMRQEWADKEKAILKDAAQFEMELGKQKISVEKAYLDSEVSMGKMSAEQRLTAEKGFADQEYALELQSLNNYIATLTVGTLAYRQAMEKRLLLTASYEAQIAKIAQQTEKEREQYALQADQAITTSLGSLIDNLVNRTTTLKKAWMDFATQLQQSLVKIASNEVMKQFLGAGTSGGSALSSITSKIFGTGGGAQAATEQANTTALTALTTALTANTAALQTSGAGGSLGFGGSGAGNSGVFGFSDLLSGGGLLGFEEGTNYVPSTSLAVVHKGEAVVPAKYNVGGSGMTARTYINVAGPIDTRSQDQISKAAAKGIHRASRRVS